MKDDNRYCQHCYCLKNKCVESLFGPQLLYYYRKVTMDQGFDLEETDSDGEELVPEDIVHNHFATLLNQLQFATAVIDGVDLKTHKAEGSSGYKNKPLPMCIKNGSYKKCMLWLEKETVCKDWGLDIDEDSTEVPLAVVNLYRPFNSEDEY